MIDLEARWKSLCARHCTDVSLVHRRWNELKDAYTVPKRYYHNLGHISFMMEEFDRLSHNIVHQEAFQMAIFTHDQVYNVKKKDNEERSAELAEKVMTELGFSSESIAMTVAHVHATKSHEVSENEEINLLVDLDMAIFGQPWEIYADYARNIRQEYDIYPDILYKPGRKKVLKVFLEMDSIFKTESYKTLYEKAARTNVHRELETL